jgi:hypothetical protein
MVELYLNELRDLLLPPGQPVQNLEIKETPTGMVKIKGVTEVELTDIAMTEQIFEEGLSHRKTRKTAMNEASSRSHLIFAIIIDAYNLSTKVQTVGKLSFVDLAGSERSSKTGVDKAGMEEANAINLSLSALGNVISQLSQGDKGHVAYRSHVLTKLMKDSLGGNAKTLMFVNCSPSVYNETETKSSLEYAMRVKKIKNTVNKNVETKETKQLKQALNKVEDRYALMAQLLQGSDKAAAFAAMQKQFDDEDDS